MTNIIPTWETIRVIGKSKVVGLTMLIPFVGYLILFNYNLTDYFKLSLETIGLGTAKDDSLSRLYYLYFGLTFLGVSSLLFAFFCPNEIKTNESEHEYIENEMKVMTHARFSGLTNSYDHILCDGTKFNKEIKEYINHHSSSLKSAKDMNFGNLEVTHNYSQKIRETAEINILTFNWKYKNSQSKHVMRGGISIGYLLGFVLVLIPSGSVFISVLTTIISKWWHP